MNALMGRQRSGGMRSPDANMSVEEFQSLTHYRRMYKAKHLSDTTGGSASAVCSYVASHKVSRLSTQDIPRRSNNKDSIPLCLGSTTSSLDKLLPDAPVAKSTAAAEPKNVALMRNMSNLYKYPPIPMKPHNRNSSLSSLTDSTRSTRSTCRTASTRVTSVSSPDVAGARSSRGASRSNPSRGLCPLEEGEPMVFDGTYMRRSDEPRSTTRPRLKRGKKMNPNHASKPSTSTQASVASGSPHPSIGKSSAWSASVYDPFELDHLLQRTPQIGDGDIRYETPGVSEGCPAVEGVSVSPLILPEHSNLTYSRRSPLVGSRPSAATVLAPPIQFMPSNHSSIVERDSPLFGSGLAPPGFPPRPLLASPSAFPLTPASSFLSTPPSSVTRRDAGLSEAGERHGTPAEFMLHRRRPAWAHQRDLLGAQLQVSSPGDLHLSSPRRLVPGLPVTPVDSLEDLSTYFSPPVGPGKPLYLEPMAGLGFKLINRDHINRDSRDEPLRRAVTAHGATPGAVWSEEDFLDYYFESPSQAEEDTVPRRNRQTTF